MVYRFLLFLWLLVFFFTCLALFFVVDFGLFVFSFLLHYLNAIFFVERGISAFMAKAIYNLQFTFLSFFAVWQFIFTTLIIWTKTAKHERQKLKLQIAFEWRRRQRFSFLLFLSAVLFGFLFSQRHSPAQKKIKQRISVWKIVWRGGRERERERKRAYQERIWKFLNQATDLQEEHEVNKIYRLLSNKIT